MTARGLLKYRFGYYGIFFKMSADEDTELRDLVAQNLENNGVLGKIRAELRASVFLALEQESKHTKIPIVNSDLKDYIVTKEGTIVLCIVREFLEFFDLDFSLAVFEPESGFLKDKYEGRQKLAMDLHITESENSSKRPLLAEILKRLSSGNGDFHDSFSNNKSQGGGSTNDITSEQISEARKKFDKFDMLHRGIVSRQEVRKIFVELFPGFRKGLLESFVEDELDHLDKEFNDNINFNEFLTIYKTLYFQCRSVVCGESHESNEDQNKAIGNMNKIPNKLDEKKKFDKPISVKQSLPQHFDDFLDIGTEDPFFDDPLVTDVKTKSIVNGVLNEHEDERPNTFFQDKQDKNSSKSVGSYLSTLNDLPSLSGKNINHSKENKTSLLELSKNINSIHSSKKNEYRVTENNIDGSSHDGDYEDDFQSSASHQSIGKSDVKSGSIHSTEDEIHEEIEELSLEVDDLLNDSPRGLDDLTTDRTLSPPSVVSFDYMEDILQQSANL